MTSTGVAVEHVDEGVGVGERREVPGVDDVGLDADPLHEPARS